MGTFIKKPVYVRNVPKENLSLTIREEGGFRRAANKVKAYDRVLRGLYHFPLAKEDIFVYKTYVCTVENYLKNIVANERQTTFLWVLRETIRALHDLHEGHKECHGNLEWPFSVVIRNDLTAVQSLDVVLTRLGSPSGKQKLEECKVLVNGFTSVAKQVFPGGVSPPWFSSMMRTLWTGKIRGLHNSLIFLGVKEKVTYLLEAAKRVEKAEAEGWMSWRKPVTFLKIPTAKISMDMRCSELYYILSWKPQRHKMKKMSIERWFCDTSKMQAGLCGFAGTTPLENDDVPGGNLRWDLLYGLWPAFFDQLHEKLVHHDIFVYEHYRGNAVELLQRFRQDRRVLLDFILSGSLIKKVVVPPGAVTLDDVDLDQVSVDHVLNCAKKGGMLELFEAIRAYHDSTSLPWMNSTSSGDEVFVPAFSGSPPKRAPPPIPASTPISVAAPVCAPSPVVSVSSVAKSESSNSVEERDLTVHDIETDDDDAEEVACVRVVRLNTNDVT